MIPRPIVILTIVFVGSLAWNKYEEPSQFRLACHELSLAMQAPFTKRSPFFLKPPRKHIDGGSFVIKKLDGGNASALCKAYSPNSMALFAAPGESMLTPDRMNFYSKFLLLEQKYGRRLVYIGFDKKTSRPLGMIEFGSHPNPEAGQVAGWLNEASWGTGIAKEGLAKAFHAFFESTGAQEVEGLVHEENMRCLAFLRKNHFHENGARLVRGSRMRVFTLPWAKLAELNLPKPRTAATLVACEN
ncbi:GNAT family N-acetyltransferase [bacterium]|nr:GNAT family N-acetyltransferase [bacterium]